MKRLDGQRVLLVMPRFFGYERDIRAEIERRGAVVDWLPDRPFDTPAMKALTRLRPGWVLPAADRLYEKLLTGFGAARYNTVLVVNGQTLSQRTLQRLRMAYPDARMVLYMWDSIANRAHVLDNLTLFDRVCSFDQDDVTRYGLNLRPLFYGRGFAASAAPAAAHYHISFVGTAHTDRFAVVSRLRSTLTSATSAYWYLYLQAPWVYHYYHWTRPDMRGAAITDFQFQPLDKPSVQSIFAASHAILDIEHPDQIGLTMRTLETLGSGKKLVTTNARIREYDCFSEENIHVVDRVAPSIPAGFLDAPFRPLSDSIRWKYSIEGWLDEVLELKN
jgi:hypothetical protein